MPPTKTPPSSNNGPLHLTPSSTSSPTTATSAGFGLPTTIRSTCLLAAFVVLIVQLHLMFDKVVHHANVHALECHEARAHDPPRVIYVDRNITIPQIIYKNITQIKIQKEIQYVDRIITQEPQQKDVTVAAEQEQVLLRLEEQQQQQTDNFKHTNIPKRPLPTITDQGMIIFFLHIPKTGGTTMSEPFVRNPEWRYRMVYGPRKQSNYSLEMTATLQHWQPGTKIFYEYHGGRAAPYMDWSVRDDLQHWRAMARLRNIPFFFFTVFREPLSFAVSHFNFYYANRQKDDNRYYYVPDPTQEDFIRLSLPNPQCLFCVSSEVAYYKEWRQDKHKTIHVPKTGCQAVYQAFLEDFDWIGTTETLSTQTFPMIEQIANVTFVSHLKNKSKDKIVKSNLTETALAHIRNITSLDNDIYQRARHDFPIEMWSNFQERQQTIAPVSSSSASSSSSSLSSVTTG